MARRSRLRKPFDNKPQVATEVTQPVKQPEPAPQPVKKPDGIFLGHGIEDLDPEEQERYRNMVRQVVVQVPPQKEVENTYVRVQERDYLAEGLLEAMAREAQANEHLQPLLERIEKMGRHIGKGKIIGDRMSGVRKQHDIVVTEK